MRTIDKKIFQDYEMVSKVLKYWSLSPENKITLINATGVRITFYMKYPNKMQRIVQLKHESPENAIESEYDLSLDELLIIVHNLYFLPADTLHSCRNKAEEVTALSTAYTGF